MSLFQKALETYDASVEYSGAEIEGHQILAPLFHRVREPAIEITLNRDGSLDMLKPWDEKNTWKDKRGEKHSKVVKIIIPVTEKSNGRTSAPEPNPLCEELGYLFPQGKEKYSKYIEQLSSWAASEHTHPFLQPVLAYVKSGSIVNDVQRAGIKDACDDCGDLSEKGKKMLVCWKVHGIEALEGDVPGREGSWQRPSLVRAFREWYTSTLTSDGNNRGLCMITGQNDVVASNHPKNIVGHYSNAKLISSNDMRGYSFRGRFEDEMQALTVGQEASQKIHNALQWLVAGQGVRIGGREFLCWSPQGASVPNVDEKFFDDENDPWGDSVTPSNYRDALQKTLLGKISRLPEQNSGVVLASFDATAPKSGRLSVTYYSELMGSDYLQRLHDWNERCCWYYRKGDRMTIDSPYLKSIVDCAFGKLVRSRGDWRWETDEKLLKQQFQRLFYCRTERAHVPSDIVRALVHRASALYCYPEQSMRETVLFIACAVIQKYRFDLYKEECTMELEPTKADRSYQYGRLMAVFEKAERDTYDRDDGREPITIRLQPKFCRQPLRTAAQIEAHLERAYFPRLGMPCMIYYKNLIGEIMEEIYAFPEKEWDQPLKETYLMGYYLQRRQMYQKKNQNENQNKPEEEESE